MFNGHGLMARLLSVLMCKPSEAQYLTTMQALIAHDQNRTSELGYATNHSTLGLKTSIAANNCVLWGRGT